MMSERGYAAPYPRRGEIWFVHAPGDPPDKLPRPVLIVSTNLRNAHARATTVLAVPFSTTLRDDVPLHVRMQPGETGLSETCELQPENISVVLKSGLQPGRGTRTLSESILVVVARNVVLSMGLQPRDIL
jgi:mRNA-degrading endonuclease toxin of MazEF toxin-antitoxin module